MINYKYNVAYYGSKDRLKYDDIKFIKEFWKDGNITGYFVSLKGFNSREYGYFDEKGRKIHEKYDLTLLPKCVVKYLNNHQSELFYMDDENDFREYIIK